LPAVLALLAKMAGNAGLDGILGGFRWEKKEAAGSPATSLA